MSGWPRVIRDMEGDIIQIEVCADSVFIGIDQNSICAAVALTVDQCAALIAAITDAARVVTGDGK